MQVFKLTITPEQAYILGAEESEHCIRTLRHTSGDEINCIDGWGNFYRCRIEDASPRKTVLRVLSMEAGWGEKKTGKISLAVSPLRQKDRFEWLVEKAVELGIDEIIPLSCKHSITENIKPERIQSIITSAAKQCKRALFPVLHPIMPFQSFIETPKNSLNFIGYCESKEEIANFHAEIIAAPSIMLCIGPEGDFSPQEIKMATEHEFHAISLGESRLRTETAGVFGISVIKFLKRY